MAATLFSFRYAACDYSENILIVMSEAPASFHALRVISGIIEWARHRLVLIADAASVSIGIVHYASLIVPDR